MGEHVIGDEGVSGQADVQVNDALQGCGGTPGVPSSFAFARALNVLKEHGLTAAIVVLLLDASGAFSTAIQMGGSQLCGL